MGAASDNEAPDHTAAISTENMVRVLNEIDQQARAGVLDCRATLHRLEGDLELFRDLLGFYFRDVPMLLGEISRAVSAGDAEGIRRWAHRLKGLVSNFDAHHATQAALELEQLGHNGPLPSARALLERLEAELSEVTAELRRF